MQNGLLGRVRGECQGASVGVTRGVGLPERAEQVRTGGVEQVVPIKIISQFVQLSLRSCRALGLPDGNGTM